MAALNPAMDMTSPQGLSKNLGYEATVVANDDQKHPDGRMLGRIQVRVSGVFDGIQDNLLPWAIPEYGSHCDGASSTSGTFMVPKVGTKVLVYFQEGSPLHPKYAPYTVDASTALKESEHNYPDRIVHLLQNGTLVVVDTKSDDVFIRNPGNTNIYIQGDVNLKIDGNVLEQIEGNRTTEIKGNVVEHVYGNKTLVLDGDYTELIKQSHSQYVNGSYLERISGTRAVYTAGDDLHASNGHITRNAARIDDNPAGGVTMDSSSPEEPSIPEQPEWPGIRGDLPK